jgi:hypothetical protein
MIQRVAGGRVSRFLHYSVQHRVSDICADHSKYEAVSIDVLLSHVSYPKVSNPKGVSK